MFVKEINIQEIENIKIGNAQDFTGGTGCTVVICEHGAPAGLDVRGGGPASRESELLKPLAACQKIHAVLLSGGSAFGLDAAGGVMRYLEERDIGLDVGGTKVPLVCQSCIFDLAVQDSKARPDQTMGYQACVNAEQGLYQDGSYGAGTGATVGKMQGMARCMKSGIGSYAVQTGELKVGAVVVVNAVGDIYDWKTARKVAGVLSEDRQTLAPGAFVSSMSNHDYAANTTIGVIITNAKFTKTELCKIAGMAHNGLARAIYPVHTSADGDSLYAVSSGDVKASQDAVGSLASEVVAEAILRAVMNTTSMYGYPSVKALNERKKT